LKFSRSALIASELGSFPFTTIIGRDGTNFRVVSVDGQPRPVQVAVLLALPLFCFPRSPGFSNLSALNKISKGFKIADLVAIMGTLDLVIPDIDR